jgi:hypothetical protein
LAGLSLVWHEAQSVSPLWLKLAGCHAFVLWQVLHWPAK